MIAARVQPGAVHLIEAPGVSHAHGASARLSSAWLCARAIDGQGAAAAHDAVYVVGPGGADLTAGAFGCGPVRRLCLPLGSATLGRRSLRGVLGGAERIVCWSDRLAGLACALSDVVELVSARPESCRVPPRRLARIDVFTERDATIWRERGAQPNLRPLPDATPPTDTGRADACRAIGLGDPAIVVAPLDDRPHQAGARAAAFLSTVLCETGYPVVLVCPAQAACLPAARRHHAAVGKPYPLIIAERPLPEWLPAVDIAVLPTPDGSGADAVLEAMASEAGASIVRMGVRGRASIGASPAAAASVMARLDALIAERAADGETPDAEGATIAHA